MVTPWGDENVEYTLFGELCGELYDDTDYDSAYQLDKEIVKNLSWKVLDVKQGADTAVVKMQITNLDMEGIFQKAENDSEIIEEIRKIPQNHTKTVELNVEAEKQDKKWILRVDVDFANTVTANDFLNQERFYDWKMAEGIPDNASPVLSIVKYALQRKTSNPKLKEQSRFLLYQAGNVYYMEDKTIYPDMETANNELLRYYEIPNEVGDYLKQFLQ